MNGKKSDLRKKLSISTERVEKLNILLSDPANLLINRLLALIDKYGGLDEINRRAKEAGGIENLKRRLEEENSPYLDDIVWEEYIYYYTNYGIRLVLNINAGTILIGSLMHKLGINNEFKISAFVGINNPFSVLWAFILAKLFSREDGSTSLIGLNFSNSVNK